MICMVLNGDLTFAHMCLFLFNEKYYSVAVFVNSAMK